MKRLLVASRRVAQSAPSGLRALSTTTTKTQQRRRREVPQDDGLTLADFASAGSSTINRPSKTTDAAPSDHPATFHLKTYGCQMNVNDSDIVRSLLLSAGYQESLQEDTADVLLTNTCAIREGAENKVWQRLRAIKSHYNSSSKKKNGGRLVGVLGCMAERLKEDMLEDGLADLVVGPDAYRDLPNLVKQLLEKREQGDDVDGNIMDHAVNVQLSLEETYADVTPVRKDPNDVSAFVSVMRGCNNMCSYCVVPFTRGRERSRPLSSIVRECQHLAQEEGVKEVVLLGQNVNSYHDRSEEATVANPAADYTTSNEGFTNLYRSRGGAGYYFADLVEAVSDIDPELRVRFTSPHPKDYPNALLQLMAERPNVCNQLHMPAQSGSSSLLQRMRRGYTREAYLQLMDDVCSTIPDVAISSDFITGFCGETEEEHRDTLTLMEELQYDQAYMFAYSMRGKTHAHRKMNDDVPEEVKQRRLQEIISVFREQVQTRNEKMEVGRLRLVLVEGESKKSKPDERTWTGRTDQNKRILFPAESTDEQHLMCWSDDAVAPLLSKRANWKEESTRVPLGRGDYVVVLVTEARGHTLRGRLLWKTTTSHFHQRQLSVAEETALKQTLLAEAATKDRLVAY